MKKFLYIVYLLSALVIVFPDNVCSIIHNVVPDIIVTPVEKPGSWVIIIDQTEERDPVTARVLLDQAYFDGLM